MSSRRRVAFLCFYPAYPPTNGSGAVTYGMAKHIDADAFIVQVGAASDTVVTPDDVRVETIPMEARSRWSKLLGLGKRIRRMSEACASLTPDVIMLEGASWTLYHLRLLRSLRRSCPGVPVVYHSHFVEYPWRRENSSWLLARITRYAEGRLLEEADHAFAVSDVDAESFHEVYGIRPPLLPNAVDSERFEQVEGADVERVSAKYGFRGKTVLFMGLADYGPNREGIDFLVHEVFERVHEVRPDAHLVVIGGAIEHRRPWLLNPGKIPYEDIAAVVRAADVCVAPVFSGSGTRIKILEYMASGRPVVATRKGAEGLHVTAGENILLEEDSDGFAAGIRRLLDDPTVAGQIGSRGAELVARRYAWAAILNESLSVVLDGDVPSEQLAGCDKDDP